MNRTTLGLIVGNRDVFPAELAKRGRAEIIPLLQQEGIDLVVVEPNDTPNGVVMTWKDAERCAKLFRDNAPKIDGILVTLPNFGDERAVADAIRLSGLSVPVFVHAWSDNVGELDIEHRRDSFCGKLSVCNNLSQYGIRYSVGRRHVTSPTSSEFQEELHWFLDVCRVVRGLKGARIGSIGERTPPFKTVRYSERLLETSGISVETKSLTEMVAAINALMDDDPRVAAKLAKLTGYLPATRDVPRAAMTTSAKLGVVLEEWIREYRIHAYAIQCWSAMQDALKIYPCAVMSMMSGDMLPSACEVDVMGAVAMYALQLAGGDPSALFDWNNNYGNDPDSCILFHCGNAALSFMRDARVGPNAMAVKNSPYDSCFCTLHGSLRPGPVGWARLSTNDQKGCIVGCIGEGEICGDALPTFGTTGVLKVPGLQTLMHFLAENGFEHHMALNYRPRTGALHEAFSKYLGWKIYCHNGEQGVRRENWQISPAP